MNFRTSHTEDTLEINLVPLIDVLLVILIFFTATTTFTRQKQLELTLPRAEISSTVQNALQLAVNNEGLYALNGQYLGSIPVAELAQALKETSQQTHNESLVIHADAQAPHQAVVRILEAASQAGINKLGFAIQDAP